MQIFIQLQGDKQDCHTSTLQMNEMKQSERHLNTATALGGMKPDFWPRTLQQVTVNCWPAFCTPSEMPTAVGTSPMKRRDFPPGEELLP